MATAKQRVEFLADLYEFHVDSGYEAGDPVIIQQVQGTVNDREYVEIGKGDTLVEAIDNAIERKRAAALALRKLATTPPHKAKKKGRR